MKHKKNYFMFNPKEEEPRELTAEEKEKMLKLFRNPNHQAEARQIVKIWIIEEYITQFDIFDYIDTFSYSNNQKQQIFNMYLFLREYSAEIMNNKKPDGLDELEELLFTLFEKGADDFYKSMEEPPKPTNLKSQKKLNEEEQKEIINYMNKKGEKEDGKEK